MMKKNIQVLIILLSSTMMNTWGFEMRFLFRDDSYAEKIESKAGYFTAEEAAQILLSRQYQEPTLTVEQIDNDYLPNGETLFLVVFIRNTENRFSAWGEIRCSVEGSGKSKGKIIDGIIVSHPDRPKIFILQQYIGFGDVRGIPKVNVDWVKLYKK